MCDFFFQKMENYHGDLADIVRAGGVPLITDFPVIDAHELPSDPTEDFQLPPIPPHTEEFGQPFANLRDPLLHEFQTTPFFDGQKMIPNEEMRRPLNIFSRMLQISPGSVQASPLSPRAIRPSPIVSGDMMASSSSVVSPVEHGSAMQISCPRSSSTGTGGTHGIKRRKSQAKKVVCIPAPAAAGSRPTGEVIPSDLWAWRKYGQKPIKGSPYPRGYYRCSSSKGCSARKQVERSRTEPNMLVITYTSEHNHPWPTQRNALAGSTRSQPAKGSSSKSSPQNPRLQPATNLKEEPVDLATSSSTAPLVKEEADVDTRVFDQLSNYKPMIPDSNLSSSDDFFADLAELDPDPMKLIFSLGSKSDGEITKDLDPFDIYDWGGNSFGGEAKKGL